MTADAMAVYGNNSYHRGTGYPVVIFSPGHAKLFNDADWSKFKIKAWLFENTKVPIAALPKSERPT